MRTRTGWAARLAWAGAAALVVAVPGGAAQERPTLRVAGPGGEALRIPVAFHRGYAAVSLSALEPLGWAVTEEAGGWALSHETGTSVRLRDGSPFLSWDGRLLQMTHDPYPFGEGVLTPLQLVTDVFPSRLPGAYSLGDDGVLHVRSALHWRGSRGADGRRDADRPARGESEGASDAARPGEDVSRVVVIDPGHGGRDPGATGPRGTREREDYPGLEVHLTRDSDVLVPLWQRGELATRVKGERPGVFLSLHANALPDRRSARGFETYFLSDARTEHERRVAALENAPLAMENGPAPEGAESDLGFILKELRNFDHPHWSALLAELVQARLRPVHPGPDRGVKQGPFAVITNALMPAVLVETGFITNREEERTLGEAAFQEELARALALAVVDFFERYPPERGTSPEELRREEG